MKKALRLIGYMRRLVLKKITLTKKTQSNGIAGIKDGTRLKRVTLGYDGLPTIIDAKGYIYPRRAELIFHSEYYPNWPEETWPVDPQTGLKLEIEK